MNSPKRLARIAGVLYLIVAIFAAYAFSVITGLYVAGDAATTAANVVANAGLVRIAVVADFVMVTAWIFLALTLYRLLKHVHQGAASAMVVLVAIGAGIVCLNDVFAFEGMQIATDSSYAAALGIGGANALVLMLLDIQHYGGLVSSIFMGLWLVPLGYLAYKSGMFPKALGVLLVVGGVCYPVGVLAVYVTPAFGETVKTLLINVPTVAEVWLLGYLLVLGVRSSPPADRAPVAAFGVPLDDVFQYSEVK